MRGGIPITARLLAIASLLGAGSQGIASAPVVAAAKRVAALRSQDISSAGTKQKKRRKLNRGKRR